MADFGLYNALRAKPDYEQRRKDAQAAMSIMATLNQQKRGDLEKRGAALSEIGKRFDEIASQQQDLLEQDAERVVEAEKALRNGIIEELGNWDNNPDLFLLMGGEASMNKYVKDVMGLDAMKKGIKNKENVLLAAKDHAEGKTWRPVQVGDELLPFDQQVTKFENGEIDEIQYNGAFESPKVDPLAFAEIPNPNNPYKSEPVDMGMFANYLQLKHGMNPDDAIWWIKQNQSDLQNPADPTKTRFMWGSREKPKDDALGWARLAFDQMKAKNPPEDKQTQWIADNALDLKTNPARWTQRKDKPYLTSDAFRGVQMKGSTTDRLGQVKETNRRLALLIRYPGDDNVYPVFEDQIYNGRFADADPKKNPAIRLDDINNTLLIPAITGTYGTNADAKLEQIRDYAVKQGIAKDLNIPYIEGAPASATPTTPTTPAAEGQYEADNPPH